MTPEQHVAHLLWLMEDNPEGWKAYCWRRAKELAQCPELAEVSALLESAMRSKATPTPSTPEAG